MSTKASLKPIGAWTVALTLAFLTPSLAMDEGSTNVDPTATAFDQMATLSVAELDQIRAPVGLSADSVVAQTSSAATSFRQDADRGAPTVDDMKVLRQRFELFRWGI